MHMFDYSRNYVHILRGILADHDGVSCHIFQDANSCKVFLFSIISSLEPFLIYIYNYNKDIVLVKFDIH